MNEVRFNPAPKEILSTQKQSVGLEKTDKEKPAFWGALFKILGLLFLLVIFIFVIWFGISFLKDNYFREKVENSYSAVFLNNGQVYFGKITSLKKDEMILKEVFYLQVSDSTLSNESEGLNRESQSRFNLVKLGTELHGPTDEMYINRNHVMFYEYLRDDSAVVESIRNYR